MSLSSFMDMLYRACQQPTSATNLHVVCKHISGRKGGDGTDRHNKNAWMGMVPFVLCVDV